MPGVVFCTECAGYVTPPSVLYKTVGMYTIPIHAVGAYEPPLQWLVLAKERKKIHAARQLGRLLARYCAQHALTFDCIIPVPLHWMRECLRGYNQATIMVEAMKKQYSHIPLIHPFRRSRATPPQRLLDAAARRENVKNAFGRSYWWSEKACSTALMGKHVLLIDDVYTTGATVEALIEAVAVYKPASITVLVACRVI